MDYTKINLKTKIITILSLSLSLTFIFLVFINSIGYNLLSFRSSWNQEIQFLFPQGWSFFTRDAKEPMTIVYKKIGKKYILLDNKNGNRNSFFGISRKNRLFLVEVDQTLTQLNSNDWVSLNTKNEFENFIIKDTFIAVGNFALNSYLIGDFVILKQKACPWSWRYNKDRLFLPASAIKIKVIRR